MSSVDSRIESQESCANVAGGSRFHSGIFLGIDARTGQYMIYSDDAVKLARTVVRVPSLEKWDKSLMSDVKLNAVQHAHAERN